MIDYGIAYNFANNVGPCDPINAEDGYFLFAFQGMGIFIVFDSLYPLVFLAPT